MLAGIVLLATNNVHSCDVCGGAVSSTGGDAIPGIFSNYIGLNASYRSFTSTHLTLFEDEIPIVSNELFSTYSLQGRYSLIRRLQFIANLPMSAVKKEMEEEEQYAWGLSDASFRVNYLLFDRRNDSTNTFFNLFLGTSVKAPTGRSNFRGNEAYFFHRNMLPGSGTWDFGFHVDLLWRRKEYGCTLNASSLIRGTSNNSYDFGNLYASRISFFRFFEIRKSRLMLDVGMAFSATGQDRNLHFNSVEDNTGGWMLSPSLQLNYFWKDLIFRTSAQRPIIQDLAKGQVVNNYALQAGVIYLMN